jgi:hypothetical protein
VAAINIYQSLHTVRSLLIVFVGDPEKELRIRKTIDIVSI